MRVLVVLAACLAMAGCAGREVGFFRYGPEPLPALEAGARVELFREEPDRPHQEIGELIVMGGLLEEADRLRTLLLEKARSVGAPAVKAVRMVPVPEAGDVFWNPGPFFGPGGWGVNHPMQTGGRYQTMVRGIAIVWIEDNP